MRESWLGSDTLRARRSEKSIGDMSCDVFVLNYARKLESGRDNNKQRYIPREHMGEQGCVLCCISRYAIEYSGVRTGNDAIS